MRKVDDGKKEKKNRKKKKKRMSFLVATNIVASRPPERRPTETPHVRANIFCLFRGYSVIPKFPCSRTGCLHCLLLGLVIVSVGLYLCNVQ